MAKVLEHRPDAVEVEPGVWKPTCTCGSYRAKDYAASQAVALRIAEQHALLKGCGQRRYTQAEAEQIIFDYKMKTGLAGRSRDRHAYLCTRCPGEVWHLGAAGRRMSA